MRSRADVPRLSWLPRRAVLLSGALLLLALAAAAVWLWWPSSPTATPSVTPNSDASIAPAPTTPAPLFASDEEALAAARATYEAFLATTDAILADGGTGAERLNAIAVPEVIADESEGFEEFRTRALRLLGQTTIESFILQSYNSTSRPMQPVVSAYACTSVATVDVVDSAGTSVVTATRPDLTPFEVTFAVSGDSPTGLVVSSSLVWRGPGVC